MTRPKRTSFVELVNVTVSSVKFKMESFEKAIYLWIDFLWRLEHCSRPIRFRLKAEDVYRGSQLYYFRTKQRNVKRINWRLFKSLKFKLNKSEHKAVFDVKHQGEHRTFLIIAVCFLC